MFFVKITLRSVMFIVCKFYLNQITKIPFIIKEIQLLQRKLQDFTENSGKGK
jgi:hypothetical protein